MRHLAAKHDIIVPSLVADVLRPDDIEDVTDDDSVIIRAEQHADEMDHARIIVCPVCAGAFSPEGAVHHEHFQPHVHDEIAVIHPAEETRT